MKLGFCPLLAISASLVIKQENSIREVAEHVVCKGPDCEWWVKAQSSGKRGMCAIRFNAVGGTR